MRKKTRLYLCRGLMAALLLTAFSSCKEEDKSATFTFNATLEQPSDSGNTKVRLVNERWIYWEGGDQITVGSDMSGSTPVQGDLTAFGGDFSDFNGAFSSTLPYDSKYFFALFPHHASNSISSAGGRNFIAQIYLKNEQPYRSGAQGDFTFSKNVIPMCAWYGDEAWPPHLDFHSMAGIVRLQFYNGNGNTRIKNITVTCTNNKQLCGLFNVTNQYTYNPYLVPAANTPENRVLTLTMPDGGLAFEHDTLRSFYLVLPATKGMDDSTMYALTVRITDMNDNYCERDLTVPVRRNGITYTRALGITDFPGHTNVVSLVGNGTEERPFKIYSYDELLRLRNLLNSAPAADGYRHINGQRITANTHYRIMVSNISLSSDSWDGGIQNFIGHMTYMANASSSASGTVHHGITNNTAYPLFESIEAGGIVEGLTVKCNNSNLRKQTDDYFSPFCRQNDGIIRDCHLTTPSGSISFYGKAVGGTCFAGICAINNGTIEASTTSPIITLHTNSNFAGICYRNNGTIRQCIAAAPMSANQAAQAGGICFENYNTIEDCYSDQHYTSGSTSWGGICYHNNNSRTIRHCYISASAIIQSSNTVGGIVAVNDGIVDYCWNYGSLRGSKVGGIAATVNNGKIINCFINDSALVLTLSSSAANHYAGGIAAEMTDGSIVNCYALLYHVTHLGSLGKYGSVVGHVAGGTLNHCYGLEVNAATPRFYGDTVSGERRFPNCYLVTSTSSQEGVKSILPENTHTGDANDLSDLLGLLNTAIPDGGKTWIRNTANDKTAPELQTYSYTAKSRRRR